CTGSVAARGPSRELENRSLVQDLHNRSVSSQSAYEGNEGRHELHEFLPTPHSALRTSHALWRIRTRFAVALQLLHQTVFLEFVLQRAPADAEHFGGLGAGGRHVGEGLANG